MPAQRRELGHFVYKLNNYRWLPKNRDHFYKSDIPLPHRTRRVNHYTFAQLAQMAPLLQ